MNYIEKLIIDYPDLKPCENDIRKAFDILKECYKSENKLLVCGNGGSSADSEHVTGELMKNFAKKRKLPEELISNLKAVDARLGQELSEKLEGALSAIALSGHQGILTAVANDGAPDLIFAQQVNGYGVSKDVLMAISTSGNSRNVLLAVITARAKGMKTILLSGKGGGKIAEYADVSIIVPSDETYTIQERHLPIYHALCLQLEEELF